MSRDCIDIKRGQVWWTHFKDTGQDHILMGSRPAIIVSNDVCNAFSEVIHVCPCTSAIKKPYPTQVPFILNGKINIALTDQIVPINISELDNMVYVVEDYVMHNISQAIKWQFGLEAIPYTPPKLDNAFDEHYYGSTCK